jgi:hypothetical protein
LGPAPDGGHSLQLPLPRAGSTRRSPLTPSGAGATAPSSWTCPPSCWARCSTATTLW